MVRTIEDLIADIRRRLTEYTPDQVFHMRAEGSPVVLVDVRDQQEVNDGLIPGALHLPRGFFELRVEQAIPRRETPIVVYCEGGIRSLLAAEVLERLGYRNVASMSGGFVRWRQQGHPVARPKALAPADRERYQRQLTIPEVGEAGQIKLLEARVLIVGAGGLGCPAGYYLAAAGVGTLGVLDFDLVDETNLQRQILHTAARVGQPKADSAATTLLALNPGIAVKPIQDRLTSENVQRLFEQYDLIIDGTDNFPTRYLINDACVKLGKPCVHGSVYRFEGQVTVFHPPHGPCYRCLYPEPPPPELAPSCADAGVLGVLPGVIGLLQAVEAVKLILGIGDGLIGRLLHYDALSGEFCQLKLRRDADCRYCGEEREFPGFVDYELFCASRGSA